MPEASIDYLVCGTSPFALLLAGLLAARPGTRVGRLGAPWSPYRLTRQLELSVMPASRPESWALLRAGTAETRRLLSGIGKGLVEPVDPLFVAESPAAASYLSHMRWMAAGFGFAVERVIGRGLAETGAICRIRDAALLVPGRIEPALEAWLQHAGVRDLTARATGLSGHRDGSGSLELGGDLIEAGKVVLADDAAILAHLLPEERHRVLDVVPATALLTGPAKKLTAPLLHYLDRDVTLLQRAGKGPVTALAGGDAASAPARIGGALAGQGPLHRAGQAVFRRVMTSDGAPLVGRLGRKGWVVVAGLGLGAAFFAPVVARLLAGTASPAESQYFAARDPARTTAQRAAVAERAIA